MTRIATLLIAVFLTFSACTTQSPLWYDVQPNDNALDVAWKVPVRVVLGAGTLGFSELIFAMERDSLRNEQLYAQWYHTLSPVEQQREHERNMMRIQAAGMILQGYAFRGGPLSNSMQQSYSSPVQPVVPLYTPAPMMRPAPPVSCMSNVVGGVTHTNCY